MTEAAGDGDAILGRREFIELKKGMREAVRELRLAREALEERSAALAALTTRLERLEGDYLLIRAEPFLRSLDPERQAIARRLLPIEKPTDLHSFIASL
jgi:hypothetical protein